MKDKRKSLNCAKSIYVYSNSLDLFNLTTRNCTSSCTHNYITNRFLSEEIELNAIICNTNRHFISLKIIYTGNINFITIIF